MPFDRFVGCILRGTEAEKPSHASYWNDWKYEATDTGNVYHNSGAAWVLSQGPERAETLKNKILNFDQNTVTGVLRDPFSLTKRIGYLIPTQTADSSLNLALKGMPSVGTYSLEYEATEGYYSRFTTALAERIGWFSNVAPAVVTRREHATRLKIRSKISSTSNFSYWIGFSNTAPQLSGIPFPNSAHFVVVGQSPSYNTNFQVISNDGTADSGLATSMGVAKGAGTSWNTFEIIMSDSNIIAKINTTTVTINTRLPGLTQNLYVMIFCYNAEALTKNFDIARGYFESDIS